jgi:hypothetical protein
VQSQIGDAQLFVQQKTHSEMEEEFKNDKQIKDFTEVSGLG